MDMVEHRSVRMDLLSSKEVANYLKRNDMVILPVGCIEMHGPTIPLGCDAIHAWATSILLSEKWKCLVAPPVYYAYPGASGPWPGTVDISPEITVEYLKEIVLAFLKGGFNRVVLCGTHGPLNFIFGMVVRSIYQKTGKVVVGIMPEVMPEDLMRRELGYSRGEDILVLASLKILGLHGVYDPKSNVEKQIEFPFHTIFYLKKYGGNSSLIPWCFKSDYQHTGIRKCVKLKDADKAIMVMKKAIERMEPFPKYFKRYLKEMEMLEKDKPWKKDKWSL